MQMQILQELKQANNLAKNTNLDLNKLAQRPAMNIDEPIRTPHDGPDDRYKKDDFEVQVFSTRSKEKPSPMRNVSAAKRTAKPPAA